MNPGANGECQAMANTNFGKRIPGAVFDSDLLSGWGNRNYNWEFSTGVQHELLPRVGVDVAYFRRWYGNFEVTDNLALSPADFDRFAITLPTTDARLPNAGFAAGWLLCPEASQLRRAGPAVPHAFRQVRQADRALERC